MPSLRVRLDTHLSFESAGLPQMLLAQMMGALRIENPEKERAVREMIRGAENWPECIELFHRQGSTITLPRGFFHGFVNGMASFGYEIEWDDARAGGTLLPPDLRPIELRDYQEPMCQALLECREAIGQAPTGSGKTSIALEAIRRAGRSALVIVDKASLAAQWVERCRDQLGFEAGYMGERGWEIKPITVALRQSLWARQDDLAGFWARWGFVVLDEVHHASAETVMSLMQRFPAHWRLGVSATPDRDEKLFPIVQAVIGPVVHETTPEDAGEALVQPRIRVVKTAFDFPYEPTERRINPETGRMKTFRNNYAQMMGALVDDPDRNALICEHVIREALEGHHCLIVTRRKEQVEKLAEMLTWTLQRASEMPLIFTLTGDNSGEDARVIAALIDEAESGTILLSTVADEGLDIPRLDRLFMSFPQRKIKATEQLVGRIMRPHAQKHGAVVFDFVDWQLGLIKSQFRERRQRLYGLKGWEVEFVGG